MKGYAIVLGLAAILMLISAWSISKSCCKKHSLGYRGHDVTCRRYKK